MVQNKEKIVSAISQGFEEVFFDNEKTDDFRVISQDGAHLNVLLDGRAYSVLVKSFDVSTKKATINVSGFDFDVTVREPLDRLMDKMGFLVPTKLVAKEVKSPMPGLIGSIYVEKGQSVLEGDKLLSLEAMKMENIIKSAGDGVIKNILVTKGQAVEKNSILIEFE